MARYRKPRKSVDLSKLKKDSQEYWEEILKREGLSMSRGMYPSRVAYGWEYYDSDQRNTTENTPQNKVPQPLASAAPASEGGNSPESKQINDSYGVHEDSFSEDSKP